MKDYLLEYCSVLNINLTYTEGEQILLSCGFIDNKPTINIHEIFKNCPKMISEAIIDYFIKFNNTQISIQLIKEFANDIKSPEDFTVKSPDEKYKNFVQKYVLPHVLNQQSSSNESKKNINDASGLTEGNINSIIQTDFFGTISSVDPFKSIYVDDDNMIELDIVVDKIDT